MNGSMADYLKVVTPHLHPELVSPEAMSHLQALAQVLPPFSKAMLEFRLGDGQCQVDLSVFLHCQILRLPDRFLNHPVWQALQNFCREWVDPTSLLHRSVRYIGLEFDLDKSPSQVPVPCIFLAWNPATVSETQALIEMAFRLPNYSVSSKLESNLRLCVDSLPKGASLEYLGAMLSRPAEVVRAIVEGIPLKQVSDYLLQIGWTEVTNTLPSLISTLSDFGNEIRLLSFDIGDTIYPRIGLEFFPERQPKHEPQWEFFLNYLVEIGLCTLAKKNAFLAWSGFSKEADRPELWPKNLLGGDRLLGSRASSVFWRTINHIKIVYQPGIPLEAKGYVMFGHHWFDAKALATSH
jgi:hypothetical protein